MYNTLYNFSIKTYRNCLLLCQCQSTVLNFFINSKNKNVGHKNMSKRI